MRAFLVGAALLGTALAAIGSCALDQDGTGEEFIGPGTSTGSAGGEGAGNPGTACADRSECPADGPCAVYACTGGFCTPTFLPAGSEVAGAIEGDCKRVICSASGTPTEQTDAADAPAGDDCNDGSCNGITPVLTPKDDTSPCGMNGLLQCLDGVCVGCAVADDCLGSACEDPVCNASNRCGKASKPAGTVAADTSQTDCVRQECDGNGGIIATAPDPDDVPDDMIECTDGVCNGVFPTHVNQMNGADCNGGTMNCYEGMCSQCGVPGDCTAPACQTATCDGTCGVMDQPNGTDCGSGDYCFGGACSECAVAAHCPAPTECITAYACPAGTCVPTNAADGTGCPTGQCLAGACVECVDATVCPLPSPCNTVACTGNACVETPVDNGTSCGGLGATCCNGSCCLTECVNDVCVI